jgi:hypothetical protein
LIIIAESLRQHCKIALHPAMRDKNPSEISKSPFGNGFNERYA